MSHLPKAIDNIQVKKVSAGRRMRILLEGCLFESMKKFKYLIILTFFLSFFVPASWAQQDQWPWTFEGGNLQITQNSGDSFSPAIASACQNDSCLYFVVWSRKTSSGFDIYGARITQDGTVFEEDQDGIPICTAPNDQMFPSVTSDGENFFVVWQDMRSGRRWDIYGAMVTNDGTVLGPNNGFLIVTGRYDQVSPALSFDGENYLVVWQGRVNPRLRNIYLTRVSTGGDILDGGPIRLAPSPKDQASPTVAFNGENYFVVWQDFRSGKFWDIYGARVAPSGEVLDTKGIPISPIVQSSSSGWDKWSPALSWDGNSFLVIWMASKEMNIWYLEGKWVDGGGIPDIDEAPIPLADTANKIDPAILWDGKDYLLVWEEEPEGEPKIFGASILQNHQPFEVSETVQISSPDVQQSSGPGISRISRIGNEALIVWQGQGNDNYWHIYSQRLKREKFFPVGPV
jgi:hypothetical protein